VSATGKDDQPARGDGSRLLPAWLRPTDGETRWQAATAVAAAVALQFPAGGVGAAVGRATGGPP
jgi:hypothetical protein